jgi:zinc protease
MQVLDRAQPPPAGPTPQVHLAPWFQRSLANGLRVIVVEDHRLPLISLQLRMDAPLHLMGERAGAMDLLGEMLTAGTQSLTKAAFDEEVDRLGAQFSTSGDGLYAGSLTKHFPRLVALVAEACRAPAFEDSEWEHARQRALSGLQARQSDPDAIADQVARVLTYSKRHPYGEVATARTIKALTRDSMAEVHAQVFRPEHGSAVFVGDITQEEALRLTEGAFGDWSPASALHVATPKVWAAPASQAQGKLAFVHHSGASQAVLRIGCSVDLHPSDEQALAALVMNTILGGGVFNARLMQNLRETKAFTYGAYSVLESDRHVGYWLGQASVGAHVGLAALAEFHTEMERMRNEAVSASELSLALNFMAGSFGRSLEDARTLARFALNTALYGLSENHYSTYLQRLAAITPADVQAAAQRCLHPEPFALMVADKERASDVFAAGNTLEMSDEGEVIRVV